MISVTEAKAIVRAASTPLMPIIVSIGKAAGYVLAQDVLAAVDIPPFNQAAVDGYAITLEEHGPLKNLKIGGEVPAGSNKRIAHLSGQATRIFTGAPVPHGADTVVMQEKASVSNNELFINDPQLQKGSNVRPKGSEIQAGTVALRRDSFLSPAAVGFLAGIGIAEVPVFPKPSIAVIVTGNELQQPGLQLQPGQIYESNSFALNAALQQLHFVNVRTMFVHDDLKKLQQVLAGELEKTDVVLVTGGVSAGDYDFVVRAAKACSVEQLFHKVAQKPGKPLYFGRRENKLLFGLPGNPASVLTCLYQYVVPALERTAGRKELLKTKELPLAAPFTKKAGLTHFLKGWCNEKEAKPLLAQESYKMASFAYANCLITLDEWGTAYKKDDVVAVLLLPY